jgi:hypothetical protein
MFFLPDSGAKNSPYTLEQKAAVLPPQKRTGPKGSENDVIVS